MANVLIVGFEKLESRVVRDKVDAVIKKMGKAHDAISTILPAETKWCGSHSHAPYLIVRHTKLKEAKTVAIALNKALNLEVEFDKVDGFLASVP